MTMEPQVEKVRGYCVLCTAHCATVATVEDGRVTRLDPDHDHPNGGAICVKGKAAPELVYNGERLDYPLRRTNPKGAEDPGWERVGWDEALDDIAARLLGIRERYGAEAIAMARGTASGTSTDDVNQWSSRLLNRIGSPNSVSTTHVCNWHRDTVFSYTFGVPQPSPDVLRSGAFLLWGHNPSSTQLMLAQDTVTARKRGMKIVVVDPRRVGLGSQADVLLQVRPGADGALALALVHVMIEEGRYDEDFVRDWTNGPFPAAHGHRRGVDRGGCDGRRQSGPLHGLGRGLGAGGGLRSACPGLHGRRRAAGAARKRQRAGRGRRRGVVRAGIRRPGAAGRVPYARTLRDRHAGPRGSGPRSGPCPERQPAREHVHVERCRAAYQRESDEPGHIHPVRAAGGYRCVGRQPDAAHGAVSRGGRQGVPSRRDGSQAHRS